MQKKNGTEAPPHLYDLTSLQVDCNKKFSMSAELTLNTIQSLYEKKLTTYPRVDTTFLTDDIYPKCPQILGGLKGYEAYMQPLAGKKLPKSKKVFDNSKVTDHHAIIPTGVPAQNLTDMERHVYDLIARRFICVFYPDCKFATTTVTGQAGEVEFKVSGKTILDQGWRAVYAKVDRADVSDKSDVSDLSDQSDTAKNAEERTLPLFTKGDRKSVV